MILFSKLFKILKGLLNKIVSLQESLEGLTFKAFFYDYVFMGMSPSGKGT